MTGRESPFIFEDAVPRDKFFDRREEIDFFVRYLRVKRKMLLSIVAPLKYGKSSLMLRYYEILKKQKDIIPIYINLKVEDRPIATIVEELFRNGIDVRGEYQSARESGSLKELFKKIDDFLAKKDLWLFLLFDEFHLLPSRIKAEGFYKEFNDEDIYGFFRGFAEGARISYVVCGSVIEPLMRALDIWGGRFQIIYLGPFPEDDAIFMLKKLFAKGGIQINDDIAKEIAEAAGYHPFYMQYMGHQIYMSGSVNRLSIRNAKKELYIFLSPIFYEYLKRIRRLGINYLKAIKKLLNEDALNIDDRICLGDLVRMGILKPKNSRYEFVDPLFKRYISLILEDLEPSEVTIVGHWAERIVGNYLLRRGYIPYYSHDSKGAFDIYVRIRDHDVGIQVKYSTSGETYLSDKEYTEIQETAKNLGWIPILALVQKTISFFPIKSPGKYRANEGYRDIDEAVKNYSN